MSEFVTWQDEEKEDFRHTFLSWYNREKRDLPWRVSKDPYRIWVSEIMLQQTRVDTVIPYFLNFMGLFPTIQALAEADEDVLLKAWEGLGYYSRVRNLQKAAKQIVAEFNGEMPEEPAEIATLKGIGPYTTGAIASMAFNKPTPAVDGNVMRVVSRLFEIGDDIAKPQSRKIFEQVMTEIISQQEPGDFNQSMMDLGSAICTPLNPQCLTCPINEFCAAYEQGTIDKYPVKSKKAKAKPVYYVGTIIRNEEGAFLLEKRPESGLLANMWTFPLLAEENVIGQTNVKLGTLSKATESAVQEQLLKNIQNELESSYHITPVLLKKPFAEAKHIFTHLKWFLSIYYGQVNESQTILPENCQWVQAKDFDKYTFPGPQQKMWQAYQENFQANDPQDIF